MTGKMRGSAILASGQVISLDFVHSRANARKLMDEDSFIIREAKLLVRMILLVVRHRIQVKEAHLLPVVLQSSFLWLLLRICQEPAGGTISKT